MRMRISYRNYPLSEELTNRSRKIAVFTNPLACMCIGIIPGIAAMVLLPNSVEVPMMLMMLGMVGGLVLAPIIRKKKYAKLDAEYEEIVRASKQG